MLRQIQNVKPIQKDRIAEETECMNQINMTYTPCKNYLTWIK